MSKVKRVVLVGHCGADTAMLSHVASEALKGCEQSVAHSSDALKGAGPESLLLINRVLDGSFSASDGVSLIAALSAGKNPPRMMLISNYPDAQASAVQAGALPGFGKSAAHLPATADMLRRAAE